MKTLFLFLAFDFLKALAKFLGGALFIFIVGAVWYLYEVVAYPGIKAFRRTVEEAGFDKEQSDFLVECFKHKRDTTALWDKSYSVEQMKEILRAQNRTRKESTEESTET